MEAIPAYETPLPKQPENGKPGLFEKKNFSRKVSEKFGKTKAAASTGMKKVKEGVKESASSSAYWMKLKYHAIKNKK
ncbi:Eukaryotic translation initiation factor 5 like [Actinidia chinensis var. chinensis]|uniref:Eukaryotic translation initiation factor 5 like n=1 Tax=Actinidia chinensis var. chinensis TaxID=1590841 RepID=A0A2R6QR16_ACTCC|nr:Eukaryotic translation initiation factor 5 like [Actinidia chinensis var. chinensis]